MMAAMCEAAAPWYAAPVNAVAAVVCVLAVLWFIVALIDRCL